VSAESLTPTETLVLLTLLAEAQPVSNTALKTLGPELRAEGRRKLNRLGLVATDTSVRPFTHELTDAGWARCRALLIADTPPRVTAPVRAVYTLLRALGRHLDRADLQLYEVFTPATEEVAPMDDTSPTVEDRIRAAYRELAREPGAWVGLARLRSVLADLPVDEVDRELVRMNRLPDVHLNPEMNQKALSNDDRAAAVVVGDTPNHLLSIEVA
jgi:hypothetical protein